MLVALPVVVRGEQWVGVSSGPPDGACFVAVVIFELAVTATSRCVFRTPVVSTDGPDECR
jgi:hypothetical protein